MTDEDERWMRMALDVARSKGSDPSTSPLGCVIVRDGRVVGEGFHPKAGQPHAEVTCLTLSLFFG